jgi:hypothetical protein
MLYLKDLNDGTPQIAVVPAGVVERLENVGVGNELATLTVTDPDPPVSPHLLILILRSSCFI